MQNSHNINIDFVRFAYGVSDKLDIRYYAGNYCVVDCDGNIVAKYPIEEVEAEIDSWVGESLNRNKNKNKKLSLPIMIKILFILLWTTTLGINMISVVSSSDTIILLLSLTGTLFSMFLINETIRN